MQVLLELSDIKFHLIKFWNNFISSDSDPKLSPLIMNSIKRLCRSFYEIVLIFTLFKRSKMHLLLFEFFPPFMFKIKHSQR